MATGYTPLIHAYLVSGIEGLECFPWRAAVKMLSADLVGVLFYITRFPESRFPETFDIWVSLCCTHKLTMPLKRVPGRKSSDIPHNGRFGASHVSSWADGISWAEVKGAWDMDWYSHEKKWANTTPLHGSTQTGRNCFETIVPLYHEIRSLRCYVHEE